MDCYEVINKNCGCGALGCENASLNYVEFTMIVIWIFCILDKCFKLKSNGVKMASSGFVPC